MSSSPIAARPPRKRSAKGILILLLILAFVGFFVYNMAPNLVSTIIPGSDGGLSGKWVGLVEYKEGMMVRDKQPAAVKLTMKPTSLGSVIPTYKMVGEMRIAGHQVPISFEGDKVMAGREIPDLAGLIDQSSSDTLKGAMLSGGLKAQRLRFEAHGMANGSTSEIGGDLKKGTDADYAALLKQIQ